VALKILSPDITHKSDVGGVYLDLASPEAVGAAARSMLEAVRARRPEARIEGFTVQKMADRSRAHELIVGIAEDSLFGPIILFGHGGTAVEVIADRAVGFPPLNQVLAKDMIARTRVARLLRGYRDRPAADIDAVASILVRLSRIAGEIGEVAELDINPLLADEHGVVALDARVIVRPSEGPPERRLAIRPYPSELEQEIALPDGRKVRVRPIRPEDQPALMAMVARSRPEDVRLRFFRAMKALDLDFAARLTQIDYDREMALVATEPEGGADAILGVVRIIAEPDNVAAEFGVMVRSDQQGRGLGYALMRRIVDYARAKGLRRIQGHVLAENAAMLRLAKELGFAHSRSPGEEGVVRVALEL
jgi:acetyltransferase